MSSERLLREYVRAVLAEDDASAGYSAGDVMGMGMAMNPYGMHFGSGNELYQIFVKPFTDVFSTAAGKTKEAVRKAQTLAHVAFEAIATTLVPVLTDSYKEIFEKEQHEIEAIKKEYEDVYRSNWDAFRDNDVLCTAFCYSPAAFLSAAFVRKSPEAAIKMISILTGGQLDKWLEKVAKKLKANDKPPVTGLNYKGGHHSGDGGFGMGDVSVGMEGVLREADQPDAAQLLASDKVKRAVASSPKAKEMSARGQKLVRGTLQQVYKQAAGVLKARSLQDLQNKTGARLKGTEKLDQVPQEQRQKLEQAMLAGAKKSLKEFYVGNLKGQVKAAAEAGVPQDSPYIQDYNRVIQKIEAL